MSFIVSLIASYDTKVDFISQCETQDISYYNLLSIDLWDLQSELLQIKDERETSKLNRTKNVDEWSKYYSARYSVPSLWIREGLESQHSKFGSKAILKIAPQFWL